MENKIQEGIPLIKEWIETKRQEFEENHDFKELVRIVNEIEKYDVNINVKGKNVVAVKDGTVVKSLALKRSDGSYRSYGEYIVINHHDGTMTLYAHMLEGSRKVSKGDNVVQGQVIGTVGNTGKSTGTHLHFEVLIKGSPVNPIPYLP